MDAPTSLRTVLTIDSQQTDALDHDKEKLQFFQSFKVTELRKYLGDRGLRSEGNHGELSNLAYWAWHAWKLHVPLNPTEIDTQRQAHRRLKELLTLTDGTQLPDPYTITTWDDDLKLFPPVSYADLYHYLINTPGVFSHESLKAFKSLDSYNLVSSGWVQTLFLCRTNSEFAFIKAKVKPSQHSTPPYEVWVLLHAEDGWVKAARCPCMAGLGEACSHVGAVLFKLVAATDLGLNKPDTVTDVACRWNNAYVKDVVPQRISETDFQRPLYGSDRKRRRPVESSSSGGSLSFSDEEMKDILSEIAPNAVFLQCFPKTLSVEEKSSRDTGSSVSYPDTVEALVERVPSTDPQAVFSEIKNGISVDESDYLFHQTTEQSSEAAWHDQRKGRITASKMHDVYRFVKSKRNVPSKTLLKSILHGNSFGNRPPPAIKWGKEKERETKQTYRSSLTGHVNLTLQDCGLRIPKRDSHIGASPDGPLTCDCCPVRLVEVKCPYSARKTHPLTAGLSYLEADGTLSRGHQYYTQVQAQMAITGISTCEFVVWTPEGIHVESIPFDSEYWKVVKSCCDEFYLSHVVPALTHTDKENVPPSPGPSDVRKKQPARATVRPKKKTRWPCGVCSKSADKGSVSCDDCGRWFHYGQRWPEVSYSSTNC